MPPLHGSGIEICAGIGSPSFAYHHHGIVPEVMYELDANKRRSLAVCFPNASIFADVTEACIAHIPVGRIILVVYGGIPCQPIAPGGAQRGLDDYRAPIATDLLPFVAAMVGALMFTGENLEGFSTAKKMVRCSPGS